MHHNVSPEMKELLAGINTFIEKVVAPLEEQNHDIIATGEMTPAFYELCRVVQRASVAAGFHAMFMPEEAGSAGLGEYEMCLIREEIAKTARHLCMLMLGDLPFGPNKMLHALATEHQREKYLAPLVRGEMTTGIALTEPDAGSDLAAIRTTAKKVDDGWVLNGVKHFISNAPFADFLQVLAREGIDGGYSMFLVDRDAYTVGDIQHSMGGDDIQAEVLFVDAFVPEANLIGEPGQAFQYAVKFLSNERLTMASISIGMADLALSLSKKYAKERVTFGKPLIENQAIQWMIADSETELYAARAMCYDAAQRADAGEEVFREISMCKLFCTEMVGRVVDRAVQIFGGVGYMKGNTVERLYRLCRVLRIAGGSSEIQRMIIARSY
ncbi:MAG: acyl-CoA dehydrogenase family protein [Actinomycetota bacterium]|nr:acyl-CoA/acyl-ACP dehydrogenase [Actinomycetota bacterium]